MEGRFLWFYQRDWTRGRNRGMGSNEEENEEEKKGEEDDDDTARETDDKRSWVVIFTITGIKWWVLTFFSCNVSVVIVDTKVENKSRLRKKRRRDEENDLRSCFKDSLLQIKQMDNGWQSKSVTDEKRKTPYLIISPIIIVLQPKEEWKKRRRKLQQEREREPILVLDDGLRGKKIFE